MTDSDAAVWRGRVEDPALQLIEDPALQLRGSGVAIALQLIAIARGQRIIIIVPWTAKAG